MNRNAQLFRTHLRKPAQSMRVLMGVAMLGVVEWIAPVRNAAWVAACFGTMDR